MATMSMPADPAAMRRHMMADPAAGHGMGAEAMDAMGPAQMDTKHTALHGAGAPHDHGTDMNALIRRSSGRGS